jgi:hypothetical protein
MAPATLIDKRIQWQAVDSVSARAIFTNHGITVSATLSFNEEGELIDFISLDRSSTDLKEYPWSTPVGEYKIVNGLKSMTRGEAVWHYPEGNFTYGIFILEEIDYNIGGYREAGDGE